jgi:hypothetical protein
MKQGGGREVRGTTPVADCGSDSDEEVGWVDLGLLYASLHVGSQEAAFTVDARLAGNVSRFVNHDKRPNMFMQVGAGGLRAVFDGFCDFSERAS